MAPPASARDSEATPNLREITCPSCGEVVELERTLQEDSVDTYNYAVIGHEGCNAPAILRLVRRSLKAPRVKDRSIQPKASRIVINRRNRKNGSSAQTEWARLIHGRNVGVLGREDVDDGFRLWEVKARKLPQWLRDAFQQVNRHQGDQLRYVVVRHPGKQGQPVEWWIVQRAEQFIDTNGYGLVEPTEPKRRLQA